MESQPLQSEDSSIALEQFRQQWRNEVNAKSKGSSKQTQTTSKSIGGRRENASRSERPINKPPGRHSVADARNDLEFEEETSSRPDLIQKIEGLRIREVDEDDFSASTPPREPQSALEHYERAVEKESQGSLGDSLTHYRKAYRLDAKVDQSYKNKHFPVKSKGSQENQQATELVPLPLPEPVSHPSNPSEKPLPFWDMIDSFANLSIPNADPVIEGDIPPPCAIRKLPTEVLVELLQQIAARDPSVFARLALVCKRFAYYVFRDNQIWKRVALGPEFGLRSQRYEFATDVQGREAIFKRLEDRDAGEDDKETALPPVADSMFSSVTDWREFFQHHPRIRFTGVYISTVNYTRAGGISAQPGAWNTAVHIVTYYRYLRFFRDGTVISLLTTNEPTEVVHHLTKENLMLVRSNTKDHPYHPSSFNSNTSASSQHPKEGQPVPPSAQNLMKHALRGRWRLCHPSLTEDSVGSEIGSNVGVAGDVHIETEGAGPKYVYTLHLSLRPGSRSKHTTKNNKLIWKGFWSYIIRTSIWDELHLKNDKPFFFSRVKSYGLGY